MENSKKKNGVNKILIALLVLLAGGFGYYYTSANAKIKKQEQAFVDQKLELQQSLDEMEAQYNVALEDNTSMKDELEWVLSIYETNLKATTDLGVLLSEGFEDYKSALKALKKATEMDPRSPNAWYNLGLVYKKMDKIGEAKSCFEKAISFKKNFDPALYQLGVLSYKTGKFEDALRFLVKYSSVVGDRTPPEVYEKIGLSYFKLLRIDGALRNLKKAYYLTHDPIKKSKLCVNLGNCYFALGDFKLAKDYYSEAVKLDAKNKDAYYNLSKTYEKMDKKEEAVKYWKLYKELKKE